MRNNVLSEYNILMEAMEKLGDLEDQYEFELYTKMNNRIEKILSESGDRVKKLEALICTFEAYGAHDSYNATLSLAYVVVFFNMGVLVNIFNDTQYKQIFVWITYAIAVFATILFSYAYLEHKRERNK